MTTLEISIPTTSLATSPGKPHTVYHILLRLPLRSITVKKRYNDFVDLHSRLTDTVGSVPPKPLPPKSYFSRTVGNPAMTEERRDGLEKYLLGILRSDDPRWRDSPAWRTFLNLPANWSAGSSAASGTSSLGYMPGIGGGGGPITDPTLWLDTHRELKTLLHDARMYLSKRDQAGSAGEQHEASAGAKRCLVKVGSLITALDNGLKEVGSGGRGNNGWGAGKEGKELLDGEIRRRKDLVSSARKERDGLESLANSLASKRAAQNSSAAAMAADKNALFTGASASRSTFGGGRVLGAPLPETERTRELDNQGVLQLNDQYMREQDRVVEGMLKNVGRMKEIGVAIGEEIDLQNKMLEDLDRDADK
ncbi:Phox homologous domain-containing protein [Tuber brumale]|nr:Phox homologous domain-containing protein [Tuber brumale]